MTMQSFNEFDGYADFTRNQRICDVLKQLAHQYKQVVKQLAYDNLIREGGESIATLECEVIVDLIRVQMKQIGVIDEAQEWEYFNYFCDQLADQAFLAIDETEMGVEIIVAFDSLYDVDIACELEDIVPMIERQQLSLEQAVQWLGYYQSYDCYAMPTEIFIVLQAPKIVDHCLQRIACANWEDVEVVAKQERAVPIQAIYAQLQSEQQLEIDRDYQAFFDLLQRFIWEWEEQTDYRYLTKCTQKLRVRAATVRK
ncbi:MAG: hypothetical protein ACRC5Q_02120 [Culicoidibacterales bacterium]